MKLRKILISAALAGGSLTAGMIVTATPASAGSTECTQHHGWNEWNACRNKFAQGCTSGIATGDTQSGQVWCVRGSVNKA